MITCEAVEHELKCDPFPYTNIVDGHKTFELRRDDRPGGFKVGDTIRLREHDPISRRYLGPWARLEIVHVLRAFHGLQAGYAILGIRVLEAHL